MTTPDEILEHGIDEVTKILGQGIAEQIFNQIMRKKAVLPVKDTCNSQQGQSTLSHFGG
jgi:hypothetical protein